MCVSLGNLIEDEKDLFVRESIKVSEVVLCGMLSYYFFLYMYLCEGVKVWGRLMFGYKFKLFGVDKCVWGNSKFVVCLGVWECD